MFQDIVQNRSFNARLPDSILPKKRKHEGNPSQRGKNDARKEDKGAWVKNSKVHPEWKIKQGEEYGKMYHPHRDHIPKRNNTPLCGGFHIKGWCYANCPYDHDNIERNTPIFTKMGAFCQRCRRSGF